MGSNKQWNIVPAAAKHPTIVLTGGGSGGHITPLLAVAEELKKQSPKCRLIFIGQKGDVLLDVPKKHPDIQAAYGVRAGKFRRYHGLGIKQILDITTLLKNIRDFGYFLMGLGQSFRLLGMIKPDIIFIKGGFVGVPVGLAAALRGIPYVTHDSDALPGLANRIISRWAKAHAVALPKEVYKYQRDKTFSVGIPISHQFQAVDNQQQTDYKKQIGLKPSNQILFITGGGNGAQPLNQAIVNLSPKLLRNWPKLVIIHAAGHKNFKGVKTRYNEILKDKKLHQRVIVKDFFEGNLYLYSGAADIIVTRAGATTIAEFAAQHKCCIVVPNPILTGGHQLKNAQIWAKQKAAVIVNNDDLDVPEKLYGPIQTLLDDPEQRRQLGKHLGKFAKPRAAKELAELLIEVIK